MSPNYEELEKLNDLKVKGIITEDEFNAKKQEILGNITIQREQEKKAYESFNSHYQRAFRRYDAVIKEAKYTGKYPGFNKLAGWNWGAFFFGPFWMLYKKRFIDFVIYVLLFVIGLGVGGAIFLIPGVYWFAFAIWGDFYEYYRQKTGKVVSWKAPKTMVKELI